MPDLEEAAAGAGRIPRGYVWCLPVWWQPGMEPYDEDAGDDVGQAWGQWLAGTNQWVLIRPSGDPKERAIAAVVTEVMQYAEGDFTISVHDVTGRRHQWCLHTWKHVGRNHFYGGENYQTGGQAVTRLFVPVREEHFVAHASDYAEFEDWREDTTFKVRTVAGTQPIVVHPQDPPPYPTPVVPWTCRAMCQPYFHEEHGGFWLGMEPVYGFTWEDPERGVAYLPTRWPWTPPSLDAEGNPDLSPEQEKQVVYRDTRNPVLCDAAHPASLVFPRYPTVIWRTAYRPVEFEQRAGRTLTVWPEHQRERRLR